MDKQQTVECVQDPQRLLELVDRDRGELVQPSVGQEALEAERAGLCEVVQLPQVGRGDPGPHADVHVDAAGGGARLGVESCDVDRDRQAVQRHIDERGDPAERGGPGPGLEVLPAGVAWVLQVHVRVDESGHQRHVVAEA